VLQSRDPDLQRYLERWTSDRKGGVFLSYASPDRRTAKEIYSALSRNGLDVWLDHNELKVGDKYNAIIQKKIKSSGAFVVCLSKAWLNREYAQKELQWAMERAGKRDNFLFPVQIKGCELPKPLKDMVHIATLTSRNKVSELSKLSDRLRSVL
jgi:hypothetical protein